MSNVRHSDYNGVVEKYSRLRLAKEIANKGPEYAHVTICAETKQSKALQIMRPSSFDSATANNASFTAMDASSLRISKLDETSFYTWNVKMQMLLEERDMWEFVSREVKLEQCITQLDRATYESKFCKVLAMFCLAMKDSLLSLVRLEKGAHDA